MSELLFDKEPTPNAGPSASRALDHLNPSELDDTVALVGRICDTPLTALGTFTGGRLKILSKTGIDVDEFFLDPTLFDDSSDGFFSVADASRDPRFTRHSLVVEEPQIKFLAAVRIYGPRGADYGLLVVMDRRARRITDAQRRSLVAQARSLGALCEVKLADITSVEEDRPAEDKGHGETFVQRHLSRYLGALVAISVVTAVKLLLDSVVEFDSPFMLFAFAVLIAAWRGGLGPGLFATFASAIIIERVAGAPGGSVFTGDSKQNLIFLIFVAQGVLISALCASRLRGEQLLQNAGKELEDRVSRRTIQLAAANRELTQEISERNQLQEDLQRARDAAVESARLKSEFLANMSHEIRTPMNGVIGMTGLLLETKLDDEQRRFAQTIRMSGESLLTIINDILDFSKIEAGKLELETLDFDLRETVESLVEMLSGRAREQRNELAALIYSDVPLYLRGDAGRIRQVLTNLVGNAIKFTRYGDIMIRVEKLHEDDQAVEIKLSVSDTGEGISDAVQQRLFQPFTQSDASTTRRFGGTGLGLSISRKLVELMSGNIGLESKLGKGSTFWFSLRLEKQPVVPTDATAEIGQPFYPELVGKRVLIVDDNDVNREVLNYQTRSWRMETAEAADGVRAVKMIEEAKKPFDLVVLDLQMPIVDGLETAQLMTDIPGGKRPPIVMISSSSFRVGADVMEDFGIRAFLNKPYRQSDLLKSIFTALGVESRVEVADEDSDIHIMASSERIVIPPSADNGKRILIAEDNSVNQMVAQNLLRKFGYHADVAANGREALRALEIIPYDLILMDCQMPEMDGYEATREIRARPWKANKIPIIALTAHVTTGERERCLEAGMDDYLGKPIDKETLRQMVTYWLWDAGENEQEEAPVSVRTPLEEPTGGPPVDFAVLDDITDYNDEMRREVVEIYLAQMVVSLFDLEQAIAEKDAKRIHELAHKAVGGSALCGMNAIVAPMRALEKLGRDGKTELALTEFNAARRAFAAIEKECRGKILKMENDLCERL